MIREVAVYCASANRIDAAYREEARALGRGLARSGYRLVYGGGNVGLMGEVARSVHEQGGNVVGYIPEKLMAIEGRAYAIADELIVTATMQERKRSIFGRVDAFVVLAGGIGTIEEFLEVLTLRKLGYHDKPIVLVNTCGYWDGLIGFLKQTEEQGFSPPLAPLFHVSPTSAECLNFLDHALPVLP